VHAHCSTENSAHKLVVQNTQNGAEKFGAQIKKINSAPETDQRKRDAKKGADL
jgi:hypothetical protein